MASDRIVRSQLWAVLVLAALGPAAAGERIARLDPETTVIAFSVGTTARDVKGTFALKESEVRFDPDTGTVSGRIVADATSGETGRARLDGNMHTKVLESALYPEIVFLPERIDGIVPARGHGEILVAGTLQIHGERHAVSFPVQIHVGDGRIAIACRFPVPYVDWGMKDPSVFVHRVEKQVAVTVAGVLRE